MRWTINVIKLRAGGRNTHDRKTIGFAVIFPALPRIQPGVELWKSNVRRRNHYLHREITVDIDWLTKSVNFSPGPKHHTHVLESRIQCPETPNYAAWQPTCFLVSSITTKLTSRTYGNHRGEWTNTKNRRVNDVRLGCTFTYLVKAPEMTAYVTMVQILDFVL